MKLHKLVLAVGGLAFVGCATAPRLETPPASAIAAGPAGFTQLIRADTLNRAFFEEQITQSMEGIRAASDGIVDILALSGGGAGGSFGAGVLVGLTKANTRPKFEIVTGVSTGALIAPFAFLGPDWDGRLTEAFNGKSTTDLMKSRGFGALFDVGIFQGKPLRRLVDRFVTDDMVAGVAKEAATGRMLLVATTNLDREETQIWNLGAIARQGGPKARALFRDVLVASASVPGVFPPVLISVTDGKTSWQEMHVDGGASTPFFIAPDIAMIPGYAPEALQGGNIYVIINGQASSSPHTTKNNTIDITARSFTAVLSYMTSTALAQTDSFASRSGMTFHFTTIPRDVEFGGSLAFDEPNMRATFDYGIRCAMAGLAWVTPQEALAHSEVAGTEPRPADVANCPLLPATSQP